MPLNRNQDFMFEDTTTLTTNAKSLKGALNEVNASLADIIQVDPKSFGVKGDGLTDDTVALNNLGTYLGTNGGKVTLNKTYLISAPVYVTFSNDVIVEIEGTINSKFICKNMGTLAFYNVIYAKSSDSTYRGTFICGKINIDAINCGTGYGQQNRMQAVSAVGVKHAFIKDNNISNVYGTGVFASNCSGVVYVGRNKLKDVWGYNPSVDSYGDGVYVGNGIMGAIVESNEIIHDLTNAQEVGRIGIVFEFDTKNCLARGNIIQGYNRAFHVENSQGGHRISNNNISACPIFLVWGGEKGNNETIFEDNTCSTVGFINKGQTLAFYQSLIYAGLPNANTPALRLKNNKITQVKTNMDVPQPLSINADNVVIEANNEFIADINSANRKVYAGSRKNLKFSKNTFTNISIFDISYGTNITTEDNVIQCEVFNSDYANMFTNRNTFNPTSLTIDRLIGTRPTGTFNDNTINNYSANSIDNTLMFNNVSSCEVSGNTFNRNTTDSPTTPSFKTPENKSDTFFALRHNTIKDNVLSTTRTLIFVGCWRENEGMKIIYDSVMPNWGTWAVGDEWVNTSPVASGYRRGTCVTAGSPGTWKGYGAISS